MNIFIIICITILILAMVGAIGMNAKQIESIEEHTHALNSVVMLQNKQIDIVNDAQKSNANEIDQICNHLLEIAKDIKRLDEEIETVKRDEKEIRSYYVNFREPNTAGVPWSSEVKCSDDE